jgi:homocysteine S-methyltransferase
MNNIIKRLSEKPLIFDGAMGTMIYERGVFINSCYDELCLTNPSLISGIHEEYVAAGAEVVETNTFGANRIKLGAFGLAEKVADINRAAVRLARTAAGERAYVAGSVGPCTKSLEVLDSHQSSLASAAFVEQIDILCAEGVDCIILETFTKVEELLLALSAAEQKPVPLIASFTLGSDGLTAVGTPATSVVQTLDKLARVDAIGVNCGTGPAGALEILEKIIPLTQKPVIVMPNAGFPRQVDGRMLYLTSPEYFTEYAKRFVELGARGIGGCCGTTPAHIATMVRAIKGMSGIKKHRIIKAVTQAAPDIKVVEPNKKSSFAARLLEGKEVTSIELLPPKSIDMSSLIKKARQCARAGIDAINIPDGPRASLRISPMIAALTILREAKIEPVLHYCCRDRNLIGMQADILGGYAAGIANFLIITGDPPKLGDYPDAAGVFDVDSIGLTRMVSNLNKGVDLGGNEVNPPTGIFIGVGANPCAIDMDREVRRLQEKIEAGAEYVITQPVFDVKALFALIDKVRSFPKSIPIIAGVWPLTSYRNAEFMKNEVPGVVVPDFILERMRAYTKKEDALAEGIAIAREMMEEIRAGVAGFQVSAPFGKVELALAVLGKETKGRSE